MSFWSKIEKSTEQPAASAEPKRSDQPPAPPAAAAAAATPPAVPGAPPPSAAAAPAPAPREERGAQVASRPDDLRLGRGVRLEGKLTFSGTVRIDATFQGSIVTDGVLVVGEAAKVDADIACGTVIVDGEVNGNVRAREMVELRRTAKLRGEVESPSLAIDRGAVFEGASRRPGAAGASARPSKSAAAPAT
jgi:cytoskeletal protein CcmA (bactofilin family)